MLQMRHRQSALAGSHSRHQVLGLVPIQEEPILTLDLVRTGTPQTAL